MRAHLAFWRHGARNSPQTAVIRAPKIHPGLWAILDDGCAKPGGADIQSWPSCAQPFWIGSGYAVVVRSLAERNGFEQSYKADYKIAAGAPLIAEVGDRNRRLFLALTDLSRDNDGELVGATGAAFGCPNEEDGEFVLSPSDSGCDSAPPERVRRAAQATLANPAALTRVAWIASGAPKI